MSKSNNVKNDKPEPPKRPQSDFMIYRTKNFDQIKKDNPGEKINEILSQKWKNLDEKEKKKYQNMYSEEKAKYEKDLAEYEKKYGKVERAKKESPSLNKLSKTKTDAPSPPKKPMSGFFLYKSEVYEKVKEENPDSKMTELATKISTLWSNVSAEKKLKYDDQYKDAKAKYDKQMEEYIKKYGKPEKPEKNKKSSISSNKETIPERKDLPPPPKKPLSGYFFFKADYYDKVKSENPDSKMVELSTIIAEKWKNINEKEKKKYEGQQADAKAAYDKEMEEYVKKYGKPQKKQKSKKSMK